MPLVSEGLARVRTGFPPLAGRANSQCPSDELYQIHFLLLSWWLEE
jgi:hypothetical protein